MRIALFLAAALAVVLLQGRAAAQSQGEPSTKAQSTQALKASAELRPVLASKSGRAIEMLPQSETVRWPKPYMIGTDTLVVPMSKPADSCLIVEPPREITALEACVTKSGTKSRWMMTKIRSSGKDGCPRVFDFSYVDPDDKSVQHAGTPFTAQTCGAAPESVQVY